MAKGGSVPHGEKPIWGSAFVWGLLFWAAVCVAGILLRGVRWEESYERGQMLIGMVQYPEGHPFLRYAKSAVGFHYYLSALIMQFTTSPLVICGYRSILSALFAVLPFYVLGTLLTRRVWLGHLAALLGVAEIHLFFSSYYALQVWPDKFTAGTIGQGYALFILAAFVARRWRLGLVLLGLMPVVHLSHMPVVLGVGLLLAVGLCVARPPGWIGTLAAFAGAGACGIAVVLLFHTMAPPVPEIGPFASDKNNLEVWKRYTQFEDIHRAPTATPRFGDFANTVTVAVALFLGSLAMVRRDWTRGVKISPYLWLFFYALGSGAAVALAKGAQWLMGPDVPFLLIGWMPFRSPNLSAVLLIPLMVHVLSLSGGDTARTGLRNLAVLAAAALGLRIVLYPVLPGELYERYVAPPETAMFFMFGASAAGLWRLLRGAQVFRAVWAAAAGLAWLALAAEHQYGAALVALGASVSLAVARAPELKHVPLLQFSRIAVAGGLVLLFASVLWQLHRDHMNPLENSPFEDQLAATLNQAMDPGEMLLTPHWHLNWQEKLDQPIYMTFETPLFLSYMRSLAGPSEKMLEDAYGIRFGEPWDYSLDAWRTRTTAEWRELGATYGIPYVLSPNTVPLALDPVLEGERLTLYRIRESSPN